MSNFYKESNNESSIDLFNKKLIYKSDILSLNYPNLVDFNFAEKAMYGKVNRFFIPIVANLDLISLKQFKSSANPTQNIQAISFVVDAFEALAQQFKKSTLTGKIRSDDPHLSNLKVHKSYKNYQINYDIYQTKYITALADNLNVSNILNFELFVKELLFTIGNIAKIYPMSMPAYVKSRLNSLTNSGLSVEIADLDYDNDEQKISDFVNSKNWEFYVSACNSYGFMIDIDNPWRLVADLDSEAMIEYASRYNFTDLDSILTLGFKSTQTEYFENLPQQLLAMYNQLVPENIPSTKQCGPRFIKTERYTLQSLKEKYSNTFFLKLYFTLRFLEEESQFTDAQKAKIIKDCIQISEASSQLAALGTFERFINQPFDYRGSLSYINRALKLSEDI
jgi:hypothetical protein